MHTLFTQEMVVVQPLFLGDGLRGEQLMRLFLRSSQTTWDA